MPAAGWTRADDRPSLNAEQSALAATAAPLASWVARRMSRLAPGRFEEYRDAAIDGILDAARDYDPSRGVKFSTLAHRYAARSVLNRAKYLRRKCREASTRPIGELDLIAEPRLPDLAPDFAGLLDQLPPGLREVIRMRYGEGLAYREIGGRLGYGRWAARDRETLALDLLRAAS